MRNGVFLLVAVGLFLIGSGMYHQYTAASEADTVDNEATYAGRTFDEWRTLSLNDLDSATRVQAFKAFAVFARHGRKEKSFAAIRAALARERSQLGIKEGYSALRSLGETGVPARIEGIKHDDATHRRAAIRTFSSYGTTVSEDAVSAVADAIRDGDVMVRALACESLSKMAMSSELDFSKDPPADLRPTDEVGPITSRVVLVLCTALADNVPSVRISALRALGNLRTKARGGARDFVQYFERLVANLDSSSRADLRGPSTNREVDTALDTLSKIGPEASDVLPVLKRLAEDHPGYRRSARKMIAKYEGKPVSGDGRRSR